MAPCKIEVKCAGCGKKHMMFDDQHVNLCTECLVAAWEGRPYGGSSGQVASGHKPS